VNDWAWSTGGMILVRDNRSTCPGACHSIHRRLHMVLPVIEVLQIAKLQFGYLFIYCLSVFLYTTVVETCSWLLSLCHCASVGLLSRCKYWGLGSALPAVKCFAVRIGRMWSALEYVTGVICVKVMKLLGIHGHRAAWMWPHLGDEGVVRGTGNTLESAEIENVLICSLKPTGYLVAPGLTSLFLSAVHLCVLYVPRSKRESNQIPQSSNWFVFYCALRTVAIIQVSFRF